jgi:putative selenate reductase
MTDRQPPLTPYPLQVLLGRVAAEWESRHRIFDLPTSRFYHPEPAHDLSFAMGGRRPATPLGPAAGPHTQLAQNYVLAWLAGARVFECKTVQVLDELEIERPCIDMEAVGYNVEWSQELTLEQSLVEYVKAWMMLDILGAWPPMRTVVGRAGEHLFDLSVGYDLAGIRSGSVDAFIRGLVDASATIEDLRGRIPAPFEAFRDHDFDPNIVRTVTLSTFHGCPPDEIEGIVRHLIDTYDLDVVVKLNPTLLGYDEVARLLRDPLGYDDISLDHAAFEADLQFDRATTMIPTLASYARSRNRRFGIKLSNTLVVDNDRGRLPGTVMYLSGPPLHVISMTLLDRLVEELGDLLDVGPGEAPVQVSWSAGIDSSNVADAVGLGLRPVTVCSNLLKPGGYGHLAAMLRKLHLEMTNAAAKNLDEWVDHRHVQATGRGHRDAVAAHASDMRGDGGRRYTEDEVRKPLRAVDHELQLWGCVACNVCVTVCPNDAMLHLATPEDLAVDLPDRWQYFVLAELCNDCGNCVTFCPEVGAPFAVKPRLFLDRDRFVADTGPAFLLASTGHDLVIEPGPGLDGELPRLRAVLGASEGLPLRPEDLGGWAGER